jgi:hypothetical protein
MKTAIAGVVVLASTAWAQEPPPTGTATAEPLITIGASGTVWLPSGDADDVSDESLGLRGSFTYRFMPWLAGIATFDYIFVNEKDDGDIGYYNINAGARAFKPGGRFQPYGELLLGWHKLSGDLLDDSGLGFRIGGGVMYPMGKLVANAGINYSSVSIDVMGFNVDIDALILEFGISMRI